MDEQNMQRRRRNFGSDEDEPPSLSGSQFSYGGMKRDPPSRTRNMASSSSLARHQSRLRQVRPTPLAREEEYPLDEDRSPRVVTPQSSYYRGRPDVQNPHHQQRLQEEQQRRLHPTKHYTSAAIALRRTPSQFSEISSASAAQHRRRGGSNPYQQRHQLLQQQQPQQQQHQGYPYTASTQCMTSSSGDDGTRESLSTPPGMEPAIEPQQQQHSHPRLQPQHVSPSRSGQRRPTVATTPRRAPPAVEEEVAVWVGRAQRRPYRHSRWMLTYASPVLKEALSLSSSIAFPHANPAEWEQLVAFMEPATKRTLSNSNVPHLIPWFHALDLRALLVECDAYLLPFCQRVDQPLDALRLCAIALRVERLRRTRSAAHALAATLLSDATSGSWEIALLVTVSKLLLQSLGEPEDGDETEDGDTDEEDTSKSASQIVKEIKAKNWFETSAAAELFIAYLRYLPSDCIVDQLWATNHSQISRFLHNPVVPYLIRQGMQAKHAKTAANKGGGGGVLSMFSGNQSVSNSTAAGSGAGGGGGGEHSPWLERVWRHLNRPPLVPVVQPPQQPMDPRQQQQQLDPRQEQQRAAQQTPPPQRSLSIRHQRPASTTPSVQSSTSNLPRTFAC